MDFTKQWVFWTLLILIGLWMIASYYNINGNVVMTKSIITSTDPLPEEDALSPFFPPVHPIVGDVQRTHTGECVESKPPSTDLPIKNIPMVVALDSSNMRLRNQCKI